MAFDYVHDHFRYQLWHWCLMTWDIDFGCRWAFGHPFVMKFNVCWWSFVWCVFETVFEIYMYITWKLKTVPPFSSLFRQCFEGGVFEGSLAHVGSLASFWTRLAPAGSFWVLVLIHFEFPTVRFFFFFNIFDVVWYLFPFAHTNLLNLQKIK